MATVSHLPPAKITQGTEEDLLAPPFSAPPMPSLAPLESLQICFIADEPSIF